MRNRMFVVVLAVVLGIGGYAAVALARTSQPADEVRGLVESSATDEDTKLFYLKVAEFGMELNNAVGVPAVSEESAIAIAKKEIAGMIAQDAAHITAMYTSFSDYPAGPNEPPLTLLGTTRIMKGVPAWIVTFHGVQMLRSGPCMLDANGNRIPSTSNLYVFGDSNVVLNAKTGEVLMGFSYNTPSRGYGEHGMSQRTRSCVASLRALNAILNGVVEIPPLCYTHGGGA